jgi:hypothetical protein
MNHLLIRNVQMANHGTEAKRGVPAEMVYVQLFGFIVQQRIGYASKKQSEMPSKRRGQY